VTGTTTAEVEAATGTADPRLAPLEAAAVPPAAAAAHVAGLFERHAALVLGICRGMLRDPGEAEDAAQQTFLSAYGSLLSGHTPLEEAPWVATIARNECRGRIRARMAEPPVRLDREGAAGGDSVHATAVRRAEVEALRQALVDLPMQQRRAFVLREFAGLSYDELAESLAVSLASVESLLFRARRGIRRRIDAAFAGAGGALSVPLLLRDWLLRLAAGGGETPGAAAKIAALPLAAKLAAAGTGVALVAGGAVGIDSMRPPHVAPTASPRAPARTPPRPRPPARTAPARAAHRIPHRQDVLLVEQPRVRTAAPPPARSSEAERHRAVGVPRRTGGSGRGEEQHGSAPVVVSRRERPSEGRSGGDDGSDHSGPVTQPVEQPVVAPAVPDEPAEPAPAAPPVTTTPSDGEGGSGDGSGAGGHDGSGDGGAGTDTAASAPAQPSSGSGGDSSEHQDGDFGRDGGTSPSGGSGSGSGDDGSGSNDGGSVSGH